MYDDDDSFLHERAEHERRASIGPVHRRQPQEARTANLLLCLAAVLVVLALIGAGAFFFRMFK